MLEQKLKSKLPLKDITLDISGMNDNESKEYIGSLGLKPLIYFNGLHLQENDIISMKLHSFNFLPTIEMEFKDSSGLLEDKSYPLDNSIISVYIDSKSEVYKEIRLDFKILNFNIIKKQSGSSRFSLKGSINCNYLYLQQNISLRKMTSYKALEQICKDSNLGYVSNINDSNDSMTWINPYLKGYEFIQSIVERSYLKEDSFLWTYVDLYNNLNLVDVESVIEEDVKIDNTLPTNYLTEKREKPSKNLVLTNDQAMKTSNNFFSAASIINRSTEMSLESGYRKRVHMYDITGNWSDKAGEFLIFDLDSINTPGSENDLVLLKSDNNDEDFYKNNISHEYLGKIDKDNVHLDYLYAKSQNIHNINNLQKIALKLILPTANFSLTRYQKVQVAFSNQTSNITSGHINSRLSGEWIIIGIGYETGNRKGNTLEQVVTLVRRELSKDKG